MRTFIAIELPASTLRAVRQVTQTLQQTFAEAGISRTARWTPPQNIHITLHFLGDTSPLQRNKIEADLALLARRHVPFDLTLSEIGAFPNLRQPNIIWCGASDLQTESPLARLQVNVEKLVIAAGFTAETRPFAPHVTLARSERSAAREDVHRLGLALQSAMLTSEVKNWSTVFPVDQFVFMQSDLRPSGAVYTALGRFSLQQ
jgi:2'-5' RNA ligase